MRSQWNHAYHHHFLDAGAGVSILHRSLIPTGWKNCSRRHDLQRLRTATKNRLSLDGSMLLHLHLDKLCTRVWFSIALHLAVDILLGTTFIDWFMSGIYPAGRKVVPRNSQSVAIVAWKPRNTKVDVVDASTMGVKDAEQVVDDKKRKLYNSCGMLSRLKPIYATLCFSQDEVEQSPDHQTRDTAIKSSMYARDKRCDGCICSTTFFIF